ncbi:alkylhydroperoxidase, partial [Staphylococcus chromogenes]
MNRLHTLTLDQAEGETAELFASIKRNVGKLPNAYAVIGSNAPAVLANVLQTGAALGK